MLSALGGGFAGLLCLAAPALSSAVGEGGLGQLEEPATYRLYNCQRCRMQVCICAQCDCGNLYCPGECVHHAESPCAGRVPATRDPSVAPANTQNDNGATASDESWK